MDLEAEIFGDEENELDQELQTMTLDDIRARTSALQNEITISFYYK